MRSRCAVARVHRLARRRHAPLHVLEPPRQPSPHAVAAQAPGQVERRQRCCDGRHPLLVPRGERRLQPLDAPRQLGLALGVERLQADLVALGGRRQLLPQPGELHVQLAHLAERVAQRLDGVVGRDQLAPAIEQRQRRAQPSRGDAHVVDVVGLCGCAQLLLVLAYVAQPQLDGAARRLLERRRRIQSFDRCRFGHGPPLAPVWRCIILTRSCEKRYHRIRLRAPSSKTRWDCCGACTRSSPATASRRRAVRPRAISNAISSPCAISSPTRSRRTCRRWSSR